MMGFISLLQVILFQCSLALAWDLIPRDNTTGTDAINVLRCMSFNGVDNATRVGVSNDGFLVILLNRTTGDAVAETGIYCDEQYGYKLQIDYHWSKEFDHNVNDLGTIGNVIEAIYAVNGISRLINVDDESNHGDGVFQDYREANAWLSM